MVKFTENFWGEKFQGFDILYHNMKFGQKSCSDFIDFVKERMLVEEMYSKQLVKLSRQVGSYPLHGSFSSYWQVLKQSTDKESSLHQQMVLKLQEILKEMQKYLDEQARKHKTMKDAEQETANVVQAIQALSTALGKSKEVYVARGQELEKCRKDNAGPKDVEKAETRLKKAAEDYRTQVEKYSAMRMDFDRKMTNSSQHFQDLEEQHLQQMLEFANSYIKVLEFGYQTLGEVNLEMRNQTTDLTIDRFLSLFVETKSTGTDKPASIDFEETSAAPLPPSPVSNLLVFDGDEHANVLTVNPTTSAVEEPGTKKREGILRKQNSQQQLPIGPVNGHGDASAWPRVTHSSSSRKAFMDSKLKFPSLRNLFTASKSNDEPRSNSVREPVSAPMSDSNSSQKSQPDLARATIRGSKWFLRSRKENVKKEKDTKKDPKKDKKKKGKDQPSSTPTIAEDARSESSFGSHSYDASSSGLPQLDAEGYIIRPSDNVDVLKPRSDSYEQYKQASSDSDSDGDEPKKIHVVIKPPTIQANHTGPSGDELRAQAKNLMLGNVGYSYTGGKRATTRMNEMMKRSASMTSDVMEAKLNVFDPFSPSSSSAYTNSSPPQANLSLIPPQITGGSVTSNPWDSSPDFSSITQVGSNFSSPSPAVPPPPIRTNLPGALKPNFGVAPPNVVIPLAVAFVEKVSASFAGGDETKCRTRIEGDLILTFPSGVLQTLLANPNHPALRFCLAQTKLLENVLPNKHLVTQETQIDDGRITYTFNMPNLTNQLKKQTEAKTALQPYQNIPVMKYHVTSGFGPQNAPILMVCYWKQEDRFTDMRIDYRRNPSCPPIRGCQITVPVPPDVEVTSMTSVPSGDWSPNEHNARWNIFNPPADVANVKARFEHPSESRGRIASPVQCSFQAEGILLSKVLFELASEGYNVTVIKTRVASAKYVCEADDASFSKA